MMLRAPIVNGMMLEALRTLCRLDFTRKVRAAVVASRKPNAEGQTEHEALSTVRFLDCSVEQLDREVPLLVISALLSIHNKPAGLMPLSEDRFEYYERIINTKLGAEDFPTVPAEDLAKYLGPLEVVQEALKKVFADAAYVERGTAEKSYGVTSGSPSRLMN